MTVISTRADCVTVETRIQPYEYHPASVVLTVDGVVQSTIDLDDPSHLIDEYCQHLGFLIDAMAPPKEPVRALHLGAGALAMARYVAATRPRSYQQAVDIDRDLIELVRREAPLAKGTKVKVRIGDAREELSAAPDACYELIIGDMFSGFTTPAHVTSVEFLNQVGRVLRPGGFYAANLCDGGGLAFSKGIVAAAVEMFGDVCVIADSSILNGHRYGNLIMLCAKEKLPLVELRRRVAGTAFPCRVVHGNDLVRFVGGVRPTTDDTASTSLPPPTMRFR
ncbi:spermidine synthase [Stackebrandtia soli]|uniref:spermidine synthase n=1 Tax=Stackebrandtia soli TaxID=1892856 RepID=UPI0039EC0727